MSRLRPPWRRLAGLSMLLLLSACATVRPVTPAQVAAWAEHRAYWESQDRFAIEGRLAVRVGRDGGTATLSWRQDGAAGDLHALGPLGQGAVTVMIEGADVYWRAADGAGRGAVVRVGDQSVPLPVVQLRYWVRGLPAPGDVTGLELDEAGRLQRLVQDGWEVEVDDYRDASAHPAPHRLHLERTGVRLRLLVDRWELTGASAGGAR